MWPAGPRTAGYSTPRAGSPGNLPHATFEGRDAQLEAAIQHLKDLIRDKPIEKPAPPKYPNKSFQYPAGPPAQK
jgi:hypothetical protein